MSTVVFPDPVEDPPECDSVCDTGRPCQNMGRYVFHHRVVGKLHLCRMHFRSSVRSGYQKDLS